MSSRLALESTSKLPSNQFFRSDSNFNWPCVRGSRTLKHVITERARTYLSQQPVSSIPLSSSDSNFRLNRTLTLSLIQGMLLFDNRSQDCSKLKNHGGPISAGIQPQVQGSRSEGGTTKFRGGVAHAPCLMQTCHSDSGVICHYGPVQADCVAYSGGHVHDWFAGTEAAPSTVIFRESRDVSICDTDCRLGCPSCELGKEEEKRQQS